MRLAFDGRTYDCPDPVALEGEVAIRVSRYAVLPVPEHLRRNQFSYSNAVAKLMFFALHEGPSATFHKVRSSRLQRKIFAAKQLVFACGRLLGSETFVIAIGPQPTHEADIMVFPSSLCNIVPPEHDINRSLARIKRFLDENPSAMEEIYYYSPYASKPLCVGIDEMLRTEGCACDVPFESPTLSELKESRQPRVRKGARDLFLVGAGVYSWISVLPLLRKLNFHSVIDANPIMAALVHERFGFERLDTDAERGLAALSSAKKPVVLIATYHSTHLDIARRALEIRPDAKIFIEKPPVTTRQQLDGLLNLRKRSGAFIEIGYNRRYSPFIQEALIAINAEAGPVTMTCVVKELNIPLNHWYYWPSQGTRVTGNLSHWIDLAVCFIKSSPVSVSFASASDRFKADEVSGTIVFDDGSLFTLVATDRGSQLRGVQEYIDIRRGDTTVEIGDFMRMDIMRGGSKKTRRRIKRDKGHRAMYIAFMDRLGSGAPHAYPDDDLEISTKLYLLIAGMLMTGRRHLEFENGGAE